MSLEIETMPSSSADNARNAGPPYTGLKTQILKRLM